MVSKAALFETETEIGYQGSREVVLASTLICLWCGSTFDVSWLQPALLRHGGYGETEGWRVRGCVCGAIRVVSKYTVNPRSHG